MFSNSTTSAFAEQWRNPVDFLSLLMITGGPVIQSALAQFTGPLLVPVCFSFGWISYAFSTINALVGDGRLMPPADYACKVINLETGYTRMNKSWVIGRFLRDLERPLSNEAFRIDVYAATGPHNENAPPRDKSKWLGLGSILIQIIIAILPLVRSGDWGIFVITIIGTCTAIATAALPQWRVEKLACRDQSKKKIAITTGNGSRHVVIVLGEGKCLDMEDLAAGEGPREARSWLKLGWFVRYIDEKGNLQSVSRAKALTEYKGTLNSNSGPVECNSIFLWRWLSQWYQGNRHVSRQIKNEAMKAYLTKHNLKEEVILLRGLPLPFLLTRVFCGVFIFVWVTILISVLALKENAWYLIAIGTIGMMHNAIAASVSRKPETRDIYLEKAPMSFIGDKTMDVLMDLDRWQPGFGRALLKEFFPAGLDVPKDRGERDWWSEKGRQDKRVRSKKVQQGAPKSRYKGHYDENRYRDENIGKRWDGEGIETRAGSRGQRWDGKEPVK